MSTDQIHPHDLTVACHVRAPLLLDPVDAKVETLRRCEDRGDVGGLVVRSWPDAVGLDATGPESELVDRFRRFERWADDHDVSIRPPFRLRTRSSMASETSTRVLVVPVLSLALYDGNALVGVYPHTDGETTRTATQAIGSLASGALPAPLGGSLTGATGRERAADAGGDHSGGRGVGSNQAGAGRGERRRREGRPDPLLAGAGCPDCESELVNVQGILSCRDCRWTDAELTALDSPRAKLVYLSLVDGPASVESLTAALDLSTGSTYSILRTLAERGLVERTDDGSYRLQSQQRDAPAPASNGN